MKPKEDGFVLSTGREIYANNCVIGLSPTEIGSTHLHINEGSDGGIYSDADKDWKDKKDLLTNDELMEIAEYMIQQWINFKTTIARRDE